MADDAKPNPDPQPPAGGAPPPADPPPADPPPSSGGQPFATFHTKEAFDDRLDRATRARLREMGVDPAQAKKDREELERLKKDQEERRAAEMSELEKAQDAAKKAGEEKAAAEALAARAREEAEIAKLAAAHRVPDLEYLEFRMRKCPEGEDRDEWLTKLLEDPKERVRFGVEEPSSGSTDDTPPGQKKATTSATDPKGNNAPPPKTGGSPEGTEKTAMKMTKAEFEAYKRQKYGGGGQGVRRGYKPPPR